MIVVQRNSKDPLQFTMLDSDQKTVDLDHNNCTVRILSPGGGEIIAAVPVTSTTGPVAELTPATAWSMDVDEGFAAEWHLEEDGGSREWTRWTYFDCVRRRFTTQVVDADIYKLEPMIQQQIPDGMTDLSGWRKSALQDLTTHLKAALRQYPGVVYFQNEFAPAHVAWTIRDFYRSNMAALGSDEQKKLSEYHKLGLRLIDQVMGDLSTDSNQDGAYNQDTERANRKVNWYK